MTAAHHDNHEHGAGSDEHKAEDPRTAIDAQSVEPLSAPLDFLFAEHLRQRQFAKLLTLIADGVINRKAIEGAVSFMEGDLAQHILDEEVSFFPLLKPLCEADDNIDTLLDLLAAEHREDEEASATVLGILRTMTAGEKPGEMGQAALRDFAEHLRHHLALENGVLLPLARARMTPDALRLLAQLISMRRGGAR